jgi:ribonuclease P protein component
MRRSSEFAAVIKGGRRARRGIVVVHHLPQAAPERPATVGFVVSRAVGSSTTRHRVVRRLRHVMRAHLATLPAGSATVVRALPAAADASSNTFAADVAAAVRATQGPR